MRSIATHLSFGLTTQLMSRIQPDDTSSGDPNLILITSPVRDAQSHPRRSKQEQASPSQSEPGTHPRERSQGRITKRPEVAKDRRAELGLRASAISASSPSRLPEGPSGTRKDSVLDTRGNPEGPRDRSRDLTKAIALPDQKTGVAGHTSTQHQHTTEACPTVR